MDASTPARAADARTTPGRARWVCLGCGLVVVVLSVCVLSGWALGLSTLQQLAPGLPPMTADTAIGLGCAGLGLMLLTPGSRRRSIGRVLAGVVATIGLLVIFEYLVAPVGIDQLLFRDPGSVDPGRPSPETAVALLALGSALLTADARRLPGWVHQGFLALAIAVLTSVLVSYIFGVDLLRGVSGRDGMAVHTLAAVFLLTVGAMAINPERGLFGIVRDGGGGAIAARALIPLSAAPLLLGVALEATVRHGVLDPRLGLSLFTLSMVYLVAIVMAVVVLRTRKADARVQEASDLLRAVFDHIPGGISMRDLDGRFTIVNEAGAAILGRTVAEVIGKAPGELEMTTSVIDDDREMGRSRRPVTHETRMRHGDGRDHDYQVIRYPVLEHDGKLLAFGSFAFDITEQKRTIAALDLARSRFRSIFDDAPIGMAVLALDGRFEEVNDALCEIVGLSRARLEGTDGAALMDREGLDEGLAARRELLDGHADTQTVETRYRHAAGHWVAVEMQLAVLRDFSGGPLNVLAQIQDITERRRDRAHLRHLADHDPLTGVRNRRAFERMLVRLSSHEPRGGFSGALMVIDLDQFKRVNDTLGHQAGDELIVHAVRLLQAKLRATDVIARIGGDEFAVLLPETTMADAMGVGENLLEALRATPPTIPGLTHPVSASIGVAALGGRLGESAGEALRNADRAMYEAKRSGRDGICAWDHAHTLA